LLALFGRHGWRGFTRLHGWLKPPSARREIRFPTRYGSEFYLVPGDSVDRHVIEEGFYESEVLEAVRPLLEPGAVLWVVGANFGLHAVTAKCLHPAASVVCFEPSPAIAARLAENAALNGATVELHAYALSAENSALPFFANSSGNPGMSTLRPAQGFSYDERFVVATLRAADVIERGIAPPPTAMVLDVEGAEVDVLRGFGRHLASTSLRVIVLETANDFLVTHKPADLHTLLRHAGFSFRLLERREHTAHTLSNFAATRS
jgi:FkbM family methyltransferase